jgi:hypothetical protein
MLYRLVSGRNISFVHRETQPSGCTDRVCAEVDQPRLENEQRL